MGECHPNTGKEQILVTCTMALMMTGLCRRRLGHPSQDIAAYERAVREYSDSQRCEAVYFYLGRAYMKGGQNDMALGTFEKCVGAYEGIREPHQFPLKAAREYIDRIKGR